MNEVEQTTLHLIFSAAMQEFLEKGFKSASLRNIVKTAGVTTGAFYGYYDSKEELFEAIKPDYISGVTFSGGDPLHPANHVEVAVLAKEIKETFPNKTIWLYTGDVWENVMHDPVMKYVNVLVDGEYVEELRDTKLLWKGSSNQRVIDVQKSLQQTDHKTPVLHCGNYA